MSQDTSAGMVNHPVNTSDAAKYDSRHDNLTSEREVTTDTKQGIEVTAAKMNLESSSAQLLNNLSVSSSNEQELKAPDNPPQSDTTFHKSSDADNEPKSIMDTATADEDRRKVNAENTSSVAPPMAIVRPLENKNPATEDQPPTNTTPTNTATTTETTISPNTPQHCQPSITSIFTNRHTLSDNSTIANPATIPNKEMNVVKSRTTRRKMARVKAHPNALTIYEAELTSKDRATQKEAVRQYLEKNVKDDWNWVWPAEESDPIDIMEALVRNASLDEAQNTSMDSTTYKEEWRERDIWESDPSESESEDPISPKGPININSPDKESPFRFENPDSVGQLVKQRRAARRRRHKKKLAAEMEWNTGVHCYVERRDAWTCARRVPPPEPRGIGNTPVYTNGNPHQAVDDFSDSEGWDTEVPIAKSLLPPDNAMRASINPQAYSTIYDKVIIQSLTPSCPINLSDVIKSCVHGWKRDGEWPPSSSVPEPSLAGKKKQRRLSMLSILGLNPPETKAPIPVAEKSPQTPNSIKKGLQKFWKRGDKARASPEGGAGA